MADKITETAELKVEQLFTDNDTRTLTIDNPRDNVTAAEINAVGTLIKESKVLLGDKTGADPVRFTTAKIRKSKNINLDLR